MNTPNYIKALLQPNGKKAPGRKVWSIDLETVWLPFFHATNTAGETAIASEALGAPLRLAYDADGSVKFSKTGRPIFKVVKDLADAVRLVRENFVAGLTSYAHAVIEEYPDGYKAQVEAAMKAAEPILNRDRTALTEAIIAMAEAERPKAEAVAEAKPKARARKPKAEAQAVAEAEAVIQAEAEAVKVG